jgi:hypothetical protein
VLEIHIRRVCELSASQWKIVQLNFQTLRTRSIYGCMINSLPRWKMDTILLVIWFVESSWRWFIISLLEIEIGNDDIIRLFTLEHLSTWA